MCSDKYADNRQVKFQTDISIKGPVPLGEKFLNMLKTTALVVSQNFNLFETKGLKALESIKLSVKICISEILMKFQRVSLISACCTNICLLH